MAAVGLGQAVAEAWTEVLNVERVQPDDDFFVLGGTSVLAVRLAARLRSALRREVTLRQIFEHPRLAAFVAALEAEEARAPDAPAPVELHGPTPAAATQAAQYCYRQRWAAVHAAVAPPNAHFQATFRLIGDVDVGVLIESLDEIVARHEVLRCALRVGTGGTVVQHVERRRPLAPQVVDLRALPPQERQVELQRLLAADLERPLELETGPRVRGQLIELGRRDRVLALVIDTAAYDGDWSRRILTAELSELYDARLRRRAARLAPIWVQYGAYAAWERRRLSGPRGEELLAYWRKQLEHCGPRPSLELPGAGRRCGKPVYRAATCDRQLAPATVAALRRLVRAGEATLFEAGLAALQVTLYGYDRRPSVGVLSVVSNRRWAEVARTIGNFGNFAVFSTNLSGNPDFAEILARVRAVSLEADAHADMPYEELVRALEPAAYATPWRRSCLFFTAGRAMRIVPELREVEVQEAEVPRSRTHDLGLWLGSGDDGALRLALLYDVDWLPRAAAERFLEDIESVLLEAGSRPLCRLARLARAV